jgi:predicted ATP-grasp superfamily ATP-dependent carboligase
MTKKMNNLQVSQKDMEKKIAQLEYFIKTILRTVFKQPEYHKTRLKEG